MWERFASQVLEIRGGGRPDPFWPRISTLTQQVLFAVERSLASKSEVAFG